MLSATQAGRHKSKGHWALSERDTPQGGGLGGVTTRGRVDTGLFVNGQSRKREGSGREMAETPRAADALLSSPQEFLSQFPGTFRNMS